MLDFNEKSFIASFFNEGGYVLNFSVATFDDFTLNSVGIGIKSKYGLSKAKSLQAFINEESDENILKLLYDLVQYIEFGNVRLTDENKQNLYPKLCEILSNHSSEFNFSSKLADEVKEKFDNQYIDKQMALTHN